MMRLRKAISISLENSPSNHLGSSDWHFFAALGRGDPFVLLGIWLGNRPPLTRLSDGLAQPLRALVMALEDFGA
jgi:hypothetical protein